MKLISKRFYFLLFAWVLLFPRLIHGQTLFWKNEDPAVLAGELLESMTDEELVGQVLMLGYSGTVPSKAILDWIRDKYIGGVKIFGWNADNIPDMVAGINAMQVGASQSRLGIPLFTATDQEGGWVRHVKGETSVTAGNMAIGASNLPADGYYSGFFIGRELHAMGINMNFAPTVDLYLNPYAHVIGPRAFSDNPVQAASLAVAFFHGLADAGIICTAKHFPGHGNTDMDSHTGLPVISTDFATLWDSELVPYRFLIREGLPAIMSGHIAYPVITGDSKPASLSPRMLTGVLREKLNFGGIIITDDLQMEGVMIDGLDQGEIALAALKAGNDMVMISRGPETHELIRKTLLRAVREDPVFKTSVRQSVLRILEAKLKWIKKPGGVPLYPDAANLKNLIPDREGKDYFLSLAGRSATVFRDEGLPFSPRKEKKVLLVGQYDDFLKTGKTRIPWADSLSINYNPFYSADKDEVQRVKNRAKDYDTVVFCLANPRSLQILKGLKELGGRVIVLSVLTPVYLREVPWVSTAIAVYGTGIESFQAGFAVIMGDFKSEGRPPFTMPPFP